MLMFGGGSSGSRRGKAKAKAKAKPKVKAKGKHGRHGSNVRGSGILRAAKRVAAEAGE